MTTKRRLQPRKAPRQDRAQATVKAIVDAAAYILAREGWERLTTNRIAERAGVNIASLYQYFPSKEAIAVELQRQHGDRLRDRLSGDRAPSSDRPLGSLLRERIEAAVHEHRKSPRLHAALAEELPRAARDVIGRAGADLAVEQWRRLATPLFEHVPDPDLAEFIARTAVHAVLHEACAERPELLDHPLLVDELTTLVERYLRRPAPSGSGDAP